MLEIVLGIIVGPQVLGWASVDEPVQIVALIGLAFLLFLAGLELDFDQLRGQLLKVAAIGFGISLVLAVVVGFVLDAVGFVRSPLLAAVVLTATSLGLVIPVLKEGGHSSTRSRPARDRRRVDRRLRRGAVAVVAVLPRLHGHGHEGRAARGVSSSRSR